VHFDDCTRFSVMLSIVETSRPMHPIVKAHECDASLRLRNTVVTGARRLTLSTRQNTNPICAYSQRCSYISNCFVLNLFILLLALQLDLAIDSCNCRSFYIIYRRRYGFLSEVGRDANPFGPHLQRLLKEFTDKQP
jgi:hypothetical protein